MTIQTRSSSSDTASAAGETMARNPGINNAQVGPMEVDLPSEASAIDEQNKSSSDERINRDSKLQVGLNSKERLFLLEKIDRLKLDVYHATISGIGCDENSSEAQSLGVVTRKLEAAKKSFNLLFSAENTMVPAETPYFQWKGHVFHKRKPVFLNIEDCLAHFERVMDAHRLSIEENWRRLVPAHLSTGMARWYAVQLEKQGMLTWVDFKKEVLKKYGRSQADVKEEAREKLENMLYDKRESFNKFIEEFQELKVVAEIKDEDCLVRYLFKSLPDELEEVTKFYINNAKDTEDINIDFAITKVVATYEALFKKKWAKELARTKSFSNNTNNNSGNSYNKRKFYEKKEVFGSYGSGVDTKLSCKYHPGLTNHSEKDCLLSPDIKSRIDKARKRFGHNVRICHKCKVPNYRPGHQCKEEDLKKLSKNVQKSIVPIEVEAVDDMDTDEDDNNESRMEFAALSIEDKKDCKLDAVNDFSQPPKDLMKNNSLILPITLESDKCVVRTYFLLDTGA